ncbi:tetratricopeptide repeat protein [Calothrix sp. 336/3]|uniref:tetratricopeptide repeat protein n=1 Tax=Calothrix sp. 336/3 TaxID=1337936 RepID=UPI00069BCC3B|nr:tetratricopeptide repeat protein [Calothrix sp. 336/3]
MNQALPQNKSVKTYWLGVVSIAIATTLGISIYTFLNSQLTKVPAPYGYPFAVSIPGGGNRQATLQKEITFYQGKVRQSPDSGLPLASLAQAYLKMAKATGDNNWYLFAEQSAQRSLGNLPFNNSGATIVLARVAQARHEFTTAIRLAQQVLQEQPRNDSALAILVTSNLAMGNLSQAKIAADTLVNTIPTQGHFTLQALVLAAQGQEKAANDAFKYALAAEEPGDISNSASTRIFLGQFYYKHGKLTLAEQLYQEALRISPGNQLAMLYLAELKTRKGDYQGAGRLYAQILPDSEQSSVYDYAVFRGQAKLQKLQGNTQAASQILDKAETRLRQENATANGNASFGHRRDLARLLLEKNTPTATAEALFLMQTEINIRRDAQTWDTLAWAFLRSGEVKKAQSAIQQALKMGTRDSGIFYRGAMIEQALGNQSQATTYQKLAQEVDPTFDEQARRTSDMGLDSLGF